MSGALLHHTATRLQALGFLFHSGGSLLTPEAKKISTVTPIDTMAHAQHFYFHRVNEPEHYIALVFAPTAEGHPQVSILTAPDTAAHDVTVTDDNVAPSVGILQQLIDDTIADLTTRRF